MQTKDAAPGSKPPPSPRQDQKALLQERYASLQRRLTADALDDPGLTQLISVCAQLDRRDEAVALFAKLSDPALRRGVRRDLARRGWVDPTPDPSETEGLMVAGESEPVFRERLEDAVRYLTEGRMPIVAIGSTIAFPLGLGIGALLTSVYDHLAVRLLAAVPAVFMLGIITVIAQQVLRQAVQGREDGSDLPTIRELFVRTPRLLAFAAVLGAIFLGPGATAILCDRWLIAAALLLPGLFLLPLATALLLATDDWHALRPATLARGVGRLGRTYVDTTLAVLAIIAPAVLAFALTLGRPVYTMIAVVGPLGAVPLLLAAHIVGRLLYRQRQVFAGWVDLEPKPHAGALSAPEPSTPAPEPEAATAAAKPAQPPAPASRKLPPAATKTRRGPQQQ
jgi:hypothetical protein